MFELTGSGICNVRVSAERVCFSLIQGFMRDFASGKASYFGILRVRAQGCIS